MSNELKKGDVLEGRFRIIGLIREGGMASIYDAVDASTGEDVAIKVPFMRYESDPAFFSRFEREESIGRKLHHPYLLRFIPVEKKSRPYIVMERLRGRLLSQVMADSRPMALGDAVRMTLRIARALDYMHAQGVTHRDLKPSNTMVCDDGSIRIFDFGLALAEEERRVTLAGHSPEMGTPDYMAPEQVRGRSKGARTDLYSVGAMLYEMLTGRLPFAGSDRFAIMHARVVGDPVAPRKINPAITPALEEIVLHLMERDYRKRYASAGDLIRDLEAPEMVKLTGRDERLEAPAPWKIGWRRVQATIWTIAALAAGVAVYLFLRRR
jgi:serine/threonine protein kinase